MRFTPTAKRLIGATFLFSLVLLAGFNKGLTDQTPASTLNAAIQKMERTGRFDFATELRQTEIFADRLENIGRTDAATSIQLNGWVAPLDNTTQLTIEAVGIGRSTVKVVDGVTYEQTGDGDWQVTDEQVGLFGSESDPAAMLESAVNIRYANGEETLFPSILLPSANATRLLFDVDANQFVAMMREQMETQLREQGRLAHGSAIDTSTLYPDLAGRGEIWLSDAGLPIRQIIEITTLDLEGDTIEARLTTDFSNWQDVPVSVISRIAPTPIQAEQIAIHASVIVTALVASGALLLFSRSRRAYVGVASLIVGSQLLLPFTHVLSGLRVAEAAEIDQAYVDAAEAKSAEREAAIAEMEPETHEQPFNPTASPLENRVANIQALNVVPTQTLPISLTQTLVYTSGQDTDGDGLNDEVEVYRLGTNPLSVDTDGDTLSDLIEVQGFTVGSKTWYLNPLSADSNEDRLPDNLECVARVNVDYQGNLIQRSNIGACKDSDADGVPDVWDYDNDGDGVPDQYDNSPSYTGAMTTQAHDQFALNFADYAANKPLNVTLDIRPKVENHLYLTNHVYDWPANDTQGQMTRVLTNTLANFGYSQLNAAHDGDMMVTPDIEITIPWNAATPTRNLPITGTAPTAATTPISTWLDQGYLSQFRITAEQASDGTITLRVPVMPVKDNIGDRIVAWRVILPYMPATTSWGSDHQIKLRWRVLALRDTCDFSKAPAGSSYSTYCSTTNPVNWTSSVGIVQTYYEPFHLTGLNAVEDGGSNIAIFADKDALTDTYERDLWRLSNSLLSNFLQTTVFTPTTGSSQRFDLSTIVSRFAAGSSATLDETWGIAPNALAVWNQQTTHTLRDLDNAANVQSLQHLSATLPAATNGDVATLMFLREETSRSAGLSSVSDTNVMFANGLLSVSFGTGANSAETTLTPSVTWKPFEYSAAEGKWKTMGLDTYIADLQTAVTPLLTNAELDKMALGPGITDYAAARRTALTWMSLYFSYFYNGQVRRFWQHHSVGRTINFRLDHILVLIQLKNES